MRVLLCTPYLQSPNVVSGGINIWGKNIWDYYRNLSNSKIEVDIVSFDREFNVQEDSTIFQRAIYGIKDYSRAIKETKKHLQNKRYDVLHLCTSAQLGLFKDYVIIREAHRRGTKVVLHLHFGRTPFLLEKGGFESRLLRRVLKSADTVIAIDPPSYDSLINKGYKSSYYLPNPLSTDIIKYMEDESSRTKRIDNRVLFVGHVIPSKGVLELVTACKEIVGSELVYIGTYEEGIRQEILRLARIRDNGSWVKFLGPLPHIEVIKEMLSCDVFVLPSYTEGFPNVILEAMACGCAIVATDVGAIPEMLKMDGERHCGILIKPYKTDELRNAINSMSNNVLFKKQCMDNAKVRVRQQYAIPVIWEELIKIWKNK